MDSFYIFNFFSIYMYFIDVRTSKQKYSYQINSNKSIANLKFVFIYYFKMNRIEVTIKY